MTQSQRNFAPATTAMLLWYVQIVVVFQLLKSEIQGIGFCKFYDVLTLSEILPGHTHFDTLAVFVYVDKVIVSCFQGLYGK